MHDSGDTAAGYPTVILTASDEVCTLRALADTGRGVVDY